jgi:hypothetical protein
VTREPLVLDSEDVDHIEELLETLADGYHILGPDEEKREQYERMYDRLQEARP